MYLFEFINEMGLSIFEKAETKQKAKDKMLATQKDRSLPGIYRCIGFTIDNPVIKQKKHKQRELF